MGQKSCNVRIVIVLQTIKSKERTAIVKNKINKIKSNQITITTSKPNKYINNKHNYKE